MRRVWHLWRAQLGRGGVFLPTGKTEELSWSITGDSWSDLHHTVAIALRRSTESELVELLTNNIVRRNQWGRSRSRPRAWAAWPYDACGGSSTPGRAPTATAAAPR